MRPRVTRRVGPLRKAIRAIGVCMFGAFICVATAFSAMAVNGRAKAKSVRAANSVAAVRDVNVTPFTLTTWTYVYDETDLKQPRKPPRLTQITARRADGATATLSYRDGQKATESRIRGIRDLNGQQTEVYDALHAVTKWPAEPQRFAFLNKLITSPPRDCVETSGEYLVGYTKLGGVRVVIVKEFPRRSSGMTWWRAPGLGCEDFQETFTQVREDGSFRLVSETKFVGLKLGAPDTALFAVPSDYRNIKPSEALRAWARRVGQEWNSNLQAQAEREDALYARLEREANSSKHPEN